jgi:hypothetical protein
VTCRDPLPATGTGNRQFGGGRTLQADKAAELTEDAVTGEITYVDLTGHRFKVPGSNVVCCEYEDPRAAVAPLPPEAQQQRPPWVRATPFVPEHFGAQAWTPPQAAAAVASVAPPQPSGPPIAPVIDPRSPAASKRRLARKDAGLVAPPNAVPGIIVPVAEPSDVGPDLADMMAYDGHPTNGATVPAPKPKRHRRTKAQMAAARAAGLP